MAESSFSDGNEAITDPASLFNKSRDLELLGRLSSARDNIVRLRKYIPGLIEACEKLDGESVRLIADRSLAAKLLEPDARLRIQGLVDNLEMTYHQLANLITVDEVEAAAIPESEIYADPIANFLKVVDLSPLTRSIVNVRRDVGEMSTYEAQYFMQYLRITQGLSGLQYLLRSQYIVAASQIQPILSGLLLLVLRKQEEVSGDTSSRASLDERVRVLLQQGPVQWKKKLSTVFDKRILDAALDWDELDRMWNHRNLFVHRGGFVDVPFSEQVIDSPPVGALVELKVEDVYNAFDFAGGVVMGFLLMSASLHFPGTVSSFAAVQGREVILEDLDKERWWLADGTARAMIALSEEVEIASVQVNYWLARSSRLGMSSIEDEVSTWDVDELEPIYRLAKLVLLQQDDEALNLIKILVQSGDLTNVELASWPLLSRFREMV